MVPYRCFRTNGGFIH